MEIKQTTKELDPNYKFKAKKFIKRDCFWGQGSFLMELGACYDELNRQAAENGFLKKLVINFRVRDNGGISEGQIIETLEQELESLAVKRIQKKQPLTWEEHLEIGKIFYQKKGIELKHLEPKSVFSFHQDSNAEIFIVLIDLNNAMEGNQKLSDQIMIANIETGISTMQSGNTIAFPRKGYFCVVSNR